jgi:RHS repeat-associated protein
VTASVPGHSLTYNYAASGGCGALAAAGKNTDRTSLVDNGSTTTYCYDQADRLTSSTDPRYSGTTTYDDHGNTTTLGTETLGYDSSDRHVTTTTSGSQTSTVSYLRDPLDRIVERDATEIPPLGVRGTGASNTGNAAASSVVVPKPAGTQPGDVLVAQIAWTATAGVPSVTAPTGWTLVNNTPNTLSTDSIYWHVAGGSEPTSYTFTFSAPTEGSGAMVAYTGADQVNPIDAAMAATDSTTTTHTAPGVTTTGPNDTLLVTISAAGSTTVTPASGMTERWEQATTAATGNVTAEGADQTVAAAGSTGTRTVTTAQAASTVLHTIAIRPQAMSQIRYGFVDHSDNSALEMNGLNQVLDRTISLMGGVVVTRQQTTPSATDLWSYANLHGDVSALASGSGTKTGSTFTWDPYGNPLAGQPANTSSSFSFGWEGTQLKGTEHQGDLDTVEMGARPYVTGLGRFLTVDSLEGGCANSYTYAFGDPINHPDLNGQSLLGKALCFAKRNAAAIAGIVVNAVAIALAGETGGLSLLLAGVGLALSLSSLSKCADSTASCALAVVGIATSLLALGYASAGAALMALSEAEEEGALTGSETYQKAITILTGIGSIAANAGSTFIPPKKKKKC